MSTSTVEQKLLYLNTYKKQFIEILNNKGILLRQDASLSQVLFAVYFYYKIRAFDPNMVTWKYTYFPLDGHGIYSNLNIVNLKDAYRTATGNELDLPSVFTYNKFKTVFEKLDLLKRWKILTTEEMKKNPLRTSAVESDHSLSNMVTEFMKEIDHIIPNLNIPAKIKTTDTQVSFNDAKPNTVVNIDGIDYSANVGTGGASAYIGQRPARSMIEVIYKTKYGKEINRGYINVLGNLEFIPDFYMFNTGRITSQDTAEDTLLSMNKVRFKSGSGNRIIIDNDTPSDLGLYIKFPKDIEEQIKNGTKYYMLGIFEVTNTSEGRVPNYEKPILFEHVNKLNYNKDLLNDGYRIGEGYSKNGNKEKRYYTRLQEGHIFYRNQFSEKSYGHDVIENEPVKSRYDANTRKYVYPKASNTMDLEASINFLENSNPYGDTIALQLFEGKPGFSFDTEEQLFKQVLTIETAYGNSVNATGSMFTVKDEVLATKPEFIQCTNAGYKNVPYTDPSFTPTLQFINDRGDLFFGLDNPEDDWKTRIIFYNMIGSRVFCLTEPNSLSVEMGAGSFQMDIKNLNSHTLAEENGRTYIKIPAEKTTRRSGTGYKQLKNASKNSISKFVVKFFFRNHIFKGYKNSTDYSEYNFTGDKTILKNKNGQIVKLFTGHVVHPTVFRKRKDTQPLLYDPEGGITDGAPREIWEHDYSKGINFEGLVTLDPLNSFYKAELVQHKYVHNGSLDIMSIEISDATFGQLFFGDKFYNPTIEMSYSVLSSIETGDLKFPVNILDREDHNFLNTNDLRNYNEIYSIMMSWFFMVDAMLQSFPKVLENITVNYFNINDTINNLKRIVNVNVIQETIIRKYYEPVKTFLQKTHEPSIPRWKVINPDTTFARSLYHHWLFCYEKGESRKVDQKIFDYCMEVFKKYENNIPDFINKVRQIVTVQHDDSDNPIGSLLPFNFSNPPTGLTFKNENKNGSSEKINRNFTILEDNIENPYMGFSADANDPNIPDYVKIVYCDMTWRELSTSPDKNMQSINLQAIVNKYPKIKELQKPPHNKSVVLRVFVDRPQEETPYGPPQNVKCVPDYVTGDNYQILDQALGKRVHGFAPMYEQNNFWQPYYNFLRALIEACMKPNNVLTNLFVLDFGVGYDNFYYTANSGSFMPITLPDNYTYLNKSYISPPNFFVSTYKTCRCFAKQQVDQFNYIFNFYLGNHQQFDSIYSEAFDFRMSSEENTLPFRSKSLGMFGNMKDDTSIPQKSRKTCDNMYNVGILPKNINNIISTHNPEFDNILRQMKTITPLYVIGYIDKEKHPEEYQKMLNEMGYQIAVVGSVIHETGVDVFIENFGRNQFVGILNYNLFPYFEARDKNGNFLANFQPKIHRLQTKSFSGNFSKMNENGVALSITDVGICYRLIKDKNSDKTFNNSRDIFWWNKEIENPDVYPDSLIFKLRYDSKIQSDTPNFINLCNLNRTDSICVNDCLLKPFIKTNMYG